MSQVNLNENTCEIQTDESDHQLADDFEFEYAKTVQDFQNNLINSNYIILVIIFFYCGDHFRNK